MRRHVKATRGASRLAALALGTVLLALSGCGSGGGSDEPITAADIAHGRALFQQDPGGQEGCGFCHTMAAAATTSPLAASLDSEVSEFRTKPTLLGVWQQAGANERAIREFTLHEIADAACADPRDPARCMPKKLFTGNDARDVAAFVARCGDRSGTPGCKPVAGGRQGLARKGLRLFLTSGCVGCHWANAGTDPVGPNLHGLYGSQVELRGGEKVAADDEYLIRSILEPDRQIVNGYQSGFMSSRISAAQLSADEARALVAYVKTLR